MFCLEGGIEALAREDVIVAGHRLNYAGNQPAGTTHWKLLVSASHIVLVFAFVGLYSHQHRH